MSEKKAVVGIDLGTTFSLVASLENGRPVVLPNAVGETLTASAVSVLDNGEIVVGAAARARRASHGQRTAVAFKRDMGSTKQFALADKQFTPQELSAMVLAQLKRDAEIALGCEVTEAVVTVPAYFGDLQRHATRDAGRIAGLTVERIINEPTAAAMAYGLHQRDRAMRVAVLDLGGGTFDVTVLEIVEGVIEIQGSAGDARLGGEDFDDALGEWVLRRMQESHGIDPEALDAKARARIREAAEAGKRALSASEETRIVIPELPLPNARTVLVDLPLTRAQAEDEWSALRERLRAPILRALRDAKVNTSKIDEILLVGGSSRMPCVSKLAEEIFGKRALASLPPDEAIAMGAAVQAALKQGDRAVDDIVVTDVAPFTMGLAEASTLAGAIVPGVYSPIIERGTTIPVSRTKTFCPLRDEQRELKIEVYQGEHSLCRDNQKLGEYTVNALPGKTVDENAVEVRFTYDLNGILEVEMTILSTKKKIAMVIERNPGQLTEAEIVRAQKAMQRLKFHPREALPNTTALARADALYVELSGEGRDVLGHLIARFRAALETQDPRAIEQMRAALTSFVNQHKAKWN
jgi:molecular chaperone HscC